MERVPGGTRNGLFYFCRNDLPVIGRSKGHTWRAGQVLEKTILSEKIRPPVPGPARSSFLLRSQQLLHGDLHSAHSQKADPLSEFLISPFFFFFAPGTTAVLVLKGSAYSRTESARTMRLCPCVCGRARPPGGALIRPFLESTEGGTVALVQGQKPHVVTVQ